MQKTFEGLKMEVKIRVLMYGNSNSTVYAPTLEIKIRPCMTIKEVTLTFLSFIKDDPSLEIDPFLENERYE